MFEGDTVTVVLCVALVLLVALCCWLAAREEKEGKGQ